MVMNTFVTFKIEDAMKTFIYFIRVGDAGLWAFCIM